MPKPAALLKPRKSSAWPGFKQQCSWDLLHFRQTALSVSLAINSPCGCLLLPRKGGFFGSGKTHRLITVGSNESFVSAAQGQRASRCCCLKALFVAGSSRRQSRDSNVQGRHQKLDALFLELPGQFIFVAAGVFLLSRGRV